MMFQPFSHYLGFGSTDQKTLAALAPSFSGMVVPGTIATFQHAGTGGFVLSLTAAIPGLDYAIDPRFPLFQQALPAEKKSHLTLAAAMGDLQLISSSTPTPADFPDARLDVIAKAWSDFNTGYQTSAGTKFSKYAKRLGRPLSAQAAQGPSLIIAPYFVANDTTDGWWDRSRYLFDSTRAQAPSGTKVVQVLAAQATGGLADLIAATPEDEFAVWVSNFNELNVSAADLGDYRAAIATAASSQSPFALYGGFFSVLAASVGLVGSCHGVGFSEHRNWVELPKSGPPPARYYLPRAHRYVSVELAQAMYLANPGLIACPCVDCAGTSPLSMDYESLMRHSVRSRSSEITQWSALSAAAMKTQLNHELAAYVNDINSAGLPAVRLPKALATTNHLARFHAAI